MSSRDHRPSEKRLRVVLLCACACWFAGCNCGGLGAGGGPGDAGGGDTGMLADGGIRDGGPSDGGGLMDGGTDAGPDAGVDAGGDAGVDGGQDASTDAGAPADAGTMTGACLSGASGNIAVRFRWAGSGPGSTAYVVYEQNDLPDTSRWQVSANSQSFGYTPIFDDTYLGAGGLDLEGTAFMDVALSTAGLGSIRSVTIAIYGRSFATTTSGSFSWITFAGSGASPSGGIANSTPYEWYPADATGSFTPGDSGVLLRIYPGPPSDALIVNTVEICFDAT